MESRRAGWIVQGVHANVVETRSLASCFLVDVRAVENSNGFEFFLIQVILFQFIILKHRQAR